MADENRLEKAKKFYRKAMEEFKKAEKKNDGIVLRDACGKGWLSAVEATHALFTKRGVTEAELPKSERGRRYMVFKYGDKEIRLLYSSLRDTLHIQGYYDGTLNFDEMKEYLNDLKIYIKKIEEY